MGNKLERVTPESVGISSEAILSLVEKLEDTSLTDAHGLMIARDGKICAEGYWKPYSAGRPHITWSFSKTVTATAVGIAAKMGFLALDEPLVEILSEFAPEEIGPRLKQMTVRNLLMMSSGIKDEVFGNDEDWIETLFKSDFYYEPGKGWSYISNGTSAMAAAVAKRSGMYFPDFVNTYLMERIGADTKNNRWITLPDGNVLGAGGFFCTLEDMMRIMLLYANGGAWEGEQILDAEYVKLATSKQIDNSNPLDNMPHGDVLAPCESAGYGYQLWMLDYPGAYQANGAQGQWGLVFPDKNIVIAVTQIKNGSNEQQILNLFYEFVRSVKGEALPENEEMQARLSNRLARLSLKAPVYCPYSSRAEEFSGNPYAITEGRFTFYPVFQLREHMGTDIEVTHGVDSLLFDFHDRRFAVIDFTEDGLTRHLCIAIDGTREVNWLTNPYHKYSEVHYNGYWESDSCFVIEGRWVEGTVVKTTKFNFTEDGIAVSGNQTLGSMGAFARDGDMAKGIKRIWIK